MDSEMEAPIKPSSKPLGSLGRDEMNLAEFPIALLTDRVPKEQTEAVYQDEIYDERTGRTFARKLTIKAGGYGLTTAADDEVILALIQLTRKKNNFTQRRVEFSRLELIRLLDWPSHGASYERIQLSLQRWTSVYLEYENAWRDNKTKTWTSPEGFHIIDHFKINDSRNSGEQVDLLQSFIVWNDVIFESFQAGYLKPLDYDLCMGLRNSTAKRLFRFLDKRFHHKPEWVFELKELSHMHIGLARSYEGPAHLKRNLQPAIEELQQVGFLEPLPNGEQFFKEGKEWKVRLVKKAVISDFPTLLPPAETVLPTAESEGLIARGVTPDVAREIVSAHPAEIIQKQIEHYDWLMERNTKKGEKPEGPGWLVKAISKNYSLPRGFKTKARRQQEEAARLEKVRQREEAERIQKETKALQEMERKAQEAAADAYLAGLTPEERKALNREFRQEKGYGQGKLFFEDVLFQSYVIDKLGLVREPELQS